MVASYYLSEDDIKFIKKKLVDKNWDINKLAKKLNYTTNHVYLVLRTEKKATPDFLEALKNVGIKLEGK